VSSLGYLFVMAIPGMFAAAFWTLAVGAGGVAGALMGRAGSRTGFWPLSVLGFLLAVAGQSYVAVSFAALMVRATWHHLAGIHGAWRWIGWTVAFLVGTAPPLIALFDWARQPARRLQHLAIRLTWPLTMLGFVALARHGGGAQWPWAWVPAL